MVIQSMAQFMPLSSSFHKDRGRETEHRQMPFCPWRSSYLPSSRWKLHPDHLGSSCDISPEFRLLFTTLKQPHQKQKSAPLFPTIHRHRFNDFISHAVVLIGNCSHCSHKHLFGVFLLWHFHHKAFFIILLLLLGNNEFFWFKTDFVFKFLEYLNYIKVGKSTFM